MECGDIEDISCLMFCEVKLHVFFDAYVKYMTLWSMSSVWIDECRSKECIETNVNEMMLICKICTQVRTHTHLNECMKPNWVNTGVLRWTLFMSWDDMFSSNLTTL